MNYCFIDFEFTCDGKIEKNRFIDDGRMKKSHREIISVGLVVCDKKFNIKKRYYSVIKPVENPILTEYCTKLTNITQNEINRGYDCNEVFGNIKKIIYKYSIEQIFSYGNMDKQCILYTIKWRKKHNYKCNNLYMVCNLIYDIRPLILNCVKGNLRRSPGLKEIATKLNIEINDNIHNSMDDALLLLKIYKKIYSNRDSDLTTIYTQQI